MCESLENKYTYIEFDKDHIDIKKIIDNIKKECNNMCIRLSTNNTEFGLNKNFVTKKIQKLLLDNSYKGILLSTNIIKYNQVLHKPIAFIIYHYGHKKSKALIIDVLCRSHIALKGTGHFLIKKIINKGIDNNIDIIFLEAGNGSLVYYKKLGFSEYNKNEITSSDEDYSSVSIALIIDKTMQYGGNNLLNDHQYYVIEVINKINNRCIDYLKTKINFDKNDLFYKAYKETIDNCAFSIIVYKNQKIVGLLSVEIEYGVINKYYYICCNFFYDNPIIGNIILKKLLSLKKENDIYKIELFSNEDNLVIENNGFKKSSIQLGDLTFYIL